MTVNGRTVHLCARCTGQVIGALTLIFSFLAIAPFRLSLFLPATQIMFVLSPLPAALDWLTQSLGRRESTNAVRVITGILLGMSYTDVLILLLYGRWLLFLAAVVGIALYVGAIALVLRVTGGWRRVLEEHFPGYEVDSGRLE